MSELVDRLRSEAEGFRKASLDDIVEDADKALNEVYKQAMTNLGIVMDNAADTIATQQAQIEALEAEIAGLIKGQKLLVHLHGLLSEEVIGFKTIKHSNRGKE